MPLDDRTKCYISFILQDILQNDWWKDKNDDTIKSFFSEDVFQGEIITCLQSLRRTVTCVQSMTDILENEKSEFSSLRRYIKKIQEEFKHIINLTQGYIIFPSANGTRWQKLCKTSIKKVEEILESGLKSPEQSTLWTQFIKQNEGLSETEEYILDYMKSAKGLGEIGHKINNSLVPKRAVRRNVRVLDISFFFE